MTRATVVRALALVAVVFATAQCIDSTIPIVPPAPAPPPPPPPPLDNSIGVIASGLVAPRGGAAFATSTAVTATDVYVSLPPGSAPTGVTASITNGRTGLVVTTPVVAGGFDPIPITAGAGDTIAIAISTGPHGAPVLAFVTAAARRPPVLVRTNPPRGGHDVPLNAAVVVVFSEPINPGTLVGGSSISLLHNTTGVTGTVRFVDSFDLQAEFHATALLAPLTEYHLALTQAIQDVNGLSLDSVIDVPFTTGNTPPATGLVFASVAAGDYHTCGLTTTGAAYCWGQNPTGQLGNGSTVSSATPVPVAGGLVFKALTAGAGHTCGLTMDGAAYCWGSPVYDRVGLDTTTIKSCSSGCLTPQPVAGGLTFTSLSAGSYYSCGVTTSGAAYCWGLGFDGELGNGLGSPATGDTSFSCMPGQRAMCPTPVAVVGNLAFSAVGTARGEAANTCGVTTAGDAYCWGEGPIGVGDTTAYAHNCSDTDPVTGLYWYACSFAPALVAGNNKFTGLSNGGNFACGLTAAGNAYCWGGSGELSNAGIPYAATPVEVAVGLTFTTVSAGADHACGVTPLGAGYCWGVGTNGGLGSGTATSSATPVAVTGGLSFATISAGLYHTCGVTTDGVAYCWGVNAAGQLGNDNTTESNVPVKVSGQ